MLAALIRCIKGNTVCFYNNCASLSCRRVVTIARPYLARKFGPARSKRRICLHRPLCTTAAPFVSSHFTVDEAAIKEVLNRLRIKYVPCACTLTHVQLIHHIYSCLIKAQGGQRYPFSGGGMPILPPYQSQGRQLMETLHFAPSEFLFSCRPQL